MSKLISSLIILCGISSLALAQKDNRPCLSSDNLLLDRDKPTVYMTFEGRGKGKPTNNVESDDYVLLRLHNNSRWAIITFAGSGAWLDGAFFTSVSLCGKKRSVLRKGMEIDAEYYVQANAGRGVEAPEILRHDPLAIEVWLASGSSLLFRVAREHLAKYLNIYVPFRYEWEKYIEEKRPKTKSLNDINKYEEPRHFVYFHYYQLPEYSR